MKETSKALAAFALYRDMGPDRSLKAVGETLGKSGGFLERWSSTHGWVERARLHDAKIAEKAAAADQAARVEDAERRRKNRLKIADAERGIAGKALVLMEPKELAKRPYAVVQMLTHADGTERLDTGQATVRVDVTLAEELREFMQTTVRLEIVPPSNDPSGT